MLISRTKSLPATSSNISHYILILGMINITISLAADVVAYKLITLGPTLLPGATLIFPLTYIIGDIVAEVYGYTVAKKIIWVTLICELFFAIAIQLIIRLPSPHFWEHQLAYHAVIDPILRFVLAGILGIVSSSFINIYIISKWKILMKGKHFWLRSLGSSAIGGLVLTVVTILFGFGGNIHWSKLLGMILSVYSMEVLYSLLGIWPASIITGFLKLEEQLDVYDTKTNFNPFK